MGDEGNACPRMAFTSRNTQSLLAREGFFGLERSIIFKGENNLNIKRCIFIKKSIEFCPGMNTKLGINMTNMSFNGIRREISIYK